MVHVLRQKYIIKNMLKMNRMIVNWNAVFRRQYSVDMFDNPPDLSIKLPTYVADLIR